MSTGRHRGRLHGRWRSPRVLLAFGCVLGLGLTATAAAFVDTADTTTTSLTATTVDFTVNGDTSDGSPTALQLVTPVTDVAPGWYKKITMTFTNVGNAPVMLTIPAAPTVVSKDAAGVSVANTSGLAAGLTATLYVESPTQVNLLGTKGAASDGSADTVGPWLTALQYTGTAWTLAAGQQQTVALTLKAPSSLSPTLQGHSAVATIKFVATGQ